jgi:hypothetical protein
MSKFRTLLPFPTREYTPTDRTGRRSSILTLDESDDVQVSAKIVIDNEDDEFLQLRVRYADGWLEIAVSPLGRSLIGMAKGKSESETWDRLRKQLVEDGWKL